MTQPQNIVEFPTPHRKGSTRHPTAARVLELCTDFEILLNEHSDRPLSGDIDMTAQRTPVLESPLKRLNDFLDGFDKSKASNGSSLEGEASWATVRKSLQQKIKQFDTETFRGLVIYALGIAVKTYPDLTHVLAGRLGVGEDTLACLKVGQSSSAAATKVLAHDIIGIESIERFLLLSDEAQALLIKLFMNSVGGQTDVFRVESCINYLMEELEKCGRKKMDFLPVAEQQIILLYIKSRFRVAG